MDQSVILSISVHKLIVFKLGWGFILNYNNIIKVWWYSHPRQTQGWFWFQSTDHSTGWIYLWMTWAIHNLLMYVLDLDNRWIVNLSHWLASKWVRPHYYESKKKLIPTENKHTFVTTIIMFSKKRKISLTMLKPFTLPSGRGV